MHQHKFMFLRFSLIFFLSGLGLLNCVGVGVGFHERSVGRDIDLQLIVQNWWLDPTKFDVSKFDSGIFEFRLKHFSIFEPETTKIYKISWPLNSATADDDVFHETILFLILTKSRQLITFHERHKLFFPSSLNPFSPQNFDRILGVEKVTITRWRPDVIHVEERTAIAEPSPSPSPSSSSSSSSFETEKEEKRDVKKNQLKPAGPWLCSGRRWAARVVSFHPSVSQSVCVCVCVPATDITNHK